MSANRIASLLASSTEILHGLGLWDRVVAVSHECDYPADVTTKPRVTSTNIDPGASTKAIADGSVAALAGVVIGFMNALEIERARLIGHSLGGAIAIQAAIDYGDRVESLALIAPAGLGAEINAAYINGFITAESRKEMKPLLQQLVADPSLINRALINDMLQFKRIDGVTEALSAIAAGFIEGATQSTDLRDGLAGLSIPVKVIWGSEDKIIPPSHAEGLPESISVEILDGFGHLVQLEAASQVNHLLA